VTTYSRPDGLVEVRADHLGLPWVLVLDPEATPRRVAFLCGLAEDQAAARRRSRAAASSC
jgi:hypothetical protein